MSMMCTLEIGPELISSLWNIHPILSFIFGDFGGGGGGGGGSVLLSSSSVRIVCLYIKLKTCSRSQKYHSK